MWIKFEEDGVLVSQATKQGYIKCQWGGVCDLLYPSSKNRRGRVQENGTISPTLTAGGIGLHRVEKLCNQNKDIPRATTEN